MKIYSEICVHINLINHTNFLYENLTNLHVREYWSTFEKRIQSIRSNFNHSIIQYMIMIRLNDIGTGIGSKSELFLLDLESDA